jgi:Putative silver efflux pump
MIIGAYLPLLTLTRIEGLLFRPMVITVAFALIGALLFSLLVVPVLATFLFRPVPFGCFVGRGYSLLSTCHDIIARPPLSGQDRLPLRQ